MSDPNSTSPDILSDGPVKDILRPVFFPHEHFVYPPDDGSAIGKYFPWVTGICRKEA
jgi:hypothetical protein